MLCVSFNQQIWIWISVYTISQGDLFLCRSINEKPHKYWSKVFIDYDCPSICSCLWLGLCIEPQCLLSTDEIVPPAWNMLAPHAFSDELIFVINSNLITYLVYCISRPLESWLEIIQMYRWYQSCLIKQTQKLEWIHVLLKKPSLNPAHFAV